MTKPKYDIGQEVYVIYNNKILKKTIVGMGYTDDKKRTQCYYYLGTMMDYEGYTQFYEEHLYPTKESIIQFLD